MKLDEIPDDGRCATASMRTYVLEPRIPRGQRFTIDLDAIETIAPIRLWPD